MLHLRAALRSSGALGLRSSATWAAPAGTGTGPAVEQVATSAKGGWRLLDEYRPATSWLASAGAPGARRDEDQSKGAPGAARGLHTGGLRWQVGGRLGGSCGSVAASQCHV